MQTETVKCVAMLQNATKSKNKRCKKRQKTQKSLDKCQIDDKIQVT